MATNSAANIPTGVSGTVLQGGGVGTVSAFSTATYPAASGGTGKILYDNGTNFVESVPTFPASASATARTIVVSDGTNWVASTETYAVPGSSGNVLTSNGTNWTSAAAAGGVSFVQLNISSANFKTLFTTPLQLLAAPGAGLITIPLAFAFKLNYAGTNPYTAGNQVQWYYVGYISEPLASISNTTYINSTNKTYSVVQIENNNTVGVFENVAINVSMQTGNPSGNAAGDNTVTVAMWYVTHAALT